jgi:hypothetical protein
MSTNNLFERREYLLDKLRKKTLDTNEISELQQILENERNRGINIGDIAIVMGALIILGLIADYTSKKKFNWKNLFGLGSKKLRKSKIYVTMVNSLFMIW